MERTYPGKFVKIQILDSHMEGNKKYIDDMAVIKVIDDNREATKQLVHAGENTLVYHTGNESISVEVKNIFVSASRFSDYLQYKYARNLRD